MPILLSFSDIFLHFKNVFISHVWEVNNCTLESSLCFENAVKQFEKDDHKDALEKNRRNSGGARRCFNVIRYLYDIA